MSTNAYIGLKENNVVKYVYLHWDGYPSHAFAILNEFYNTREKVEELLSYGDISSLCPRIGNKHDFDECLSDECTFYIRDRGDSENLAEAYSVTEGEFAEACETIEYAYLFDTEWNIIKND